MQSAAYLVSVLLEGGTVPLPQAMPTATQEILQDPRSLVYDGTARKGGRRVAVAISTLLEEQERIVSAAVKLPDGTTLTGPTHSYCWDDGMERGDLDHLLPKPYDEYGDRVAPWTDLVNRLGEDYGRMCIDGFMTSKGRFIDREEAYRLAVSNGQYAGGSHLSKEGRLDVDDLQEATEPPGSYWVSPTSQLIKVASHYDILHQKGLASADKKSVDKVSEELGYGPLAEEVYKAFEKAGWIRVTLCHQTKSVYFEGHARQAQQRVVKEMAQQHQYRLVQDRAGREQVWWSPEEEEED